MGYMRNSWTMNKIRLVKKIGQSIEAVSYPLKHTIDTPCPVWFVDERQKYAGSHKVHLVSEALIAGLSDGRIGPATQLVTDSSGTTALTVATFARDMKLSCVVFCPQATSETKLEMLLDLDAQIYMFENLVACTDAVEKYCQTIDAFHIKQFAQTSWSHDPLNSYGDCFFDTVTRACGQIPTDVFASIGTGNSLMSLKRAISRRNYATQLHLVDLHNGRFHGCAPEPGPDSGVGAPIDGVNQEFVPDGINNAAFDDVTPATNAEAFAAARILGELFGISSGPSTGFVAAGAIRWRERLLQSNRTGLICLPVYDCAERYSGQLDDNLFLEQLGEDYQPAYGELLTLFQCERSGKTIAA